ncbi:MAG: hypothetical protein IPK15_27155 [Verrucomicrobia bacterium]|nr:hypothetical protein [Verrucomicrobiota bacterium]
MSLSAKREALARIHGRYGRAGRPHKTRILDEFCATCGYHRKAALRLLNRPLRTAPPKRSGPKVLYDPAEMLPVLKAIWLASEQLCSKLLKAALPQWIEHHPPTGTPLPEAFKKKLLKIVRRRSTACCVPRASNIPRRESAPRGRARCCATRCPRAAARRTPRAPAPSRPTPSRTATTAPRAITSIPSRLPSFTAAD